MKTIFVICLCIVNSQCGVIKDDLNKNYPPDNTELRQFQKQPEKEIDLFDIERETSNIKLSPRTQEWKLTFIGKRIEEIDRILTNVEAYAKKRGPIIDKKCFSDENSLTCSFKTIVDVTKKTLSKIQKRETKQNNALTTNSEEINRLLKLAEDAASGVSDGMNCTTAEDVTICNVYVPEDSTKLRRKREIEFHNNAGLLDETVDIPNCTVVTEETAPLCSLEKFYKDHFLAGTKRADIRHTIKKRAPTTHSEEINRLLKLAEDAASGVSDGKNCTTAEGVTICNVYVPEDSTKLRRKREIEIQNNTLPSEIDLENIAGTWNCTEVTEDNADICRWMHFDASDCPTGQGRADDGTCVPEVE